MLKVEMPDPDSQLLAGDELGDHQSRVIKWATTCQRRYASVDPDRTNFIVDDIRHSLRVTIFRRSGAEPSMVIEVTPEGEVTITAPALHDGFHVQFALVHEPDESLGGIEDAIRLLTDLADGNVKSELHVWNGTVVSYEDYVSVPDSGRVLLAKHTEVGVWLRALGRKKTVVTREMSLAE
jgi:hypothetical protein